MSLSIKVIYMNSKHPTIKKENSIYNSILKIIMVNKVYFLIISNEKFKYNNETQKCILIQKIVNNLNFLAIFTE